MEDGDFDQRLRDLQREYLEFLDDEVIIFNVTFLYFRTLKYYSLLYNFLNFLGGSRRVH